MNKIEVTYSNIDNNTKKVIVDKNTKIIDIVKMWSFDSQKKVVGAKINNSVVSLDTKLKRDCDINFIDSNDLAGYKMYQAGLKFVFLAAIYDVYGKNIEINFDHSIMRGMHITIGNLRITNKEIIKIKERMGKIISENLPILKMNVLSKEMVEFYKKEQKVPNCYNVLNIDDELVTIYKLENYYDYFYVEMPYSTGCLNRFDLVALNEEEVVLLFPTPRSQNEVPSYVHYEKVIECFKNEKEWLDKCDIPYVYQVNKIVANGKIKDLIRLSEINYDNKIHEVANKILNRKSKFVMIAGPSSSGKTTTCKKLSLDLQARGIKTLTISVDDYFKNRVDTPKTLDGKYDFESIASIDVESLNNDINALLRGEEVELPTYNFVSGIREYVNGKTKIDNNYIVLMEGLHCLNDDLTPYINNDIKFKIYLSPFMPLNLDSNNYISTTDLRLIRRMIRDNRTRGNDVSKTICSWQDVRSGEEKYIFPYINTSDVIINTSLVYELGVLKVFAEPLLYSVGTDSVYYEEARRLINFLKNYYPISSEYIADDCVLREFIGGSCFEG